MGATPCVSKPPWRKSMAVHLNNGAGCTKRCICSTIYRNRSGQKRNKRCTRSVGPIRHRAKFNERGCLAIARRIGYLGWDTVRKRTGNGYVDSITSPRCSDGNKIQRGYRGDGVNQAAAWLNRLNAASNDNAKSTVLSKMKHGAILRSPNDA